MGASAKALDFSGVKDRGAFNPKQVAEGDYAATIVKVEDANAKGDNGFMYVFTIKLDKYSQYSYPYRCKLQENQLWKLRNIAVAAGLNVPKKRMKFDPNKVVGKRIGVTMEDDEYEGKMKSEVSAIFPVSELAEGAIVEDDDASEEEFEEGAPVVATDDVDDEEPAPKAAKKKDKGGKKKKKKENLEELNIDDV